MGYLFAILTAIVTILGNITAKVWTQDHKKSTLALAIAFYLVSCVTFPIALKYGKLSVLNAFATIFIFVLTSAAGVFYFKEKLSTLEAVGLALALSGIIAFSAATIYKK